MKVSAVFVDAQLSDGNGCAMPCRDEAIQEQNLATVLLLRVRTQNAGAE